MIPASFRLGEWRGNYCDCVLSSGRVVVAVDFRKSPARISWRCVRCRGVGVVFVDGFDGGPVLRVNDGDGVPYDELVGLNAIHLAAGERGERGQGGLGASFFVSRDQLDRAIGLTARSGDSLEFVRPSVAVYAIVGGLTPDNVRYVGMTDNPATRLAAHRRNREWVAAMGGSPMEMFIIERCVDRKCAARRERHWINHYRAHGMADWNRHAPTFD